MSALWKAESRAFFRALGSHITTLRKSVGMTQAELARAIGVSQQAVFAYELGERRTSVLVLLKLSNVFDMSIDDIARMKRQRKVPNRRLSPKAVRHAQRLMNLSKTQQRFIIRIIDLLEGGKFKWSTNQHSRKAA